jgi:hypothetical protein
LTLILPAQRPALSAVNENSFASCHPPWAKSTLKFLYLKKPNLGDITKKPIYSALPGERQQGVFSLARLALSLALLRVVLRIRILFFSTGGYIFVCHINSGCVTECMVDGIAMAACRGLGFFVAMCRGLGFL